MKIYKKRIFLFFVVIYLMVAQTIFADSDKIKVGPELLESTPQAGAVSVDIDTEIYLIFNKNVANMTVRENNGNNIRLIDEDGKEVQIEVIFADDQLEPEKRRDIIVKPIESLAGSSTYKLQILPDFMSKNGQIVGKLIEVKFETKKEESKLPDKEEQFKLESAETKEVHLLETEVPLAQKDENIEDKEIVKKDEIDKDESKDIVDEEKDDPEEEIDELDDIKKDIDETEEADEVLDKTYEGENKPKSNLIKIISVLAIIFIIVALVLIKRVV